MMSKQEFIKSQKECASMLGMSLEEYQNYCDRVKVSNRKNVSQNSEGNTSNMLKFLGIAESMLKIKKDY